MAPRLPVDSGLRPVRLRPQASPVNTFVQPTEGQELAQLAHGLQKFAPSLGRFASVLDEREAQEQLAKGTQRARQAQEERIAYQDAIKKGLITAKDSKWFVMAFKQQYGRYAAGQYSIDLKNAILADEAMQTSIEPSDFAAFESQFRKGWLEKNVGENRDLHFEKGFEIVDGYTMDAANSFAASAGARMEKRAGDQLGDVIGQMLDQHYKEGPDMAASLIEMEMRSYLFDNPKGGRVANKQAIQSIAAWARTNYKVVGREDVEKLLRGIKAGPGSNLFGLKEAKEMLTQVEKEIISMRGAAMNLSHAEEQREERLKVDAFWSNTNASLASAASSGALAGMDLTPLITELNKINPDPSNAGRVHELRQSLLAAKGNDAAYKEGLMRVLGVSQERPGFLSMSQLASYVQSEGLSGSQFSSLVTEIQQRDQAGADNHTGAKLLRDPMVGEGREFISRSMIDLYGTNPEANRVAVANAIRDFNQSVYDNQASINELAGGKRFEQIQSLAEVALRIHAPEGVIKSQIKAGDTQAINTKTVSVFEKAIENASEGDLNAIGQAFLDYQAVQQGTRTRMSDTTRDLLVRLGVPLIDKEVKAFFLEWDRNY